MKTEKEEKRRKKKKKMNFPFSVEIYGKDTLILKVLLILKILKIKF